MYLKQYEEVKNYAYHRLTFKKRVSDLTEFQAQKKKPFVQWQTLWKRAEKYQIRMLYVEGLIKREEESTTAVGEGIAIPHYKGSAVTKPGLAAMVIKNGTDFDSIDGEPVKLIFAIAAPDTKRKCTP